MRGALLALGCAASMGLNSASVRRGVLTGTVIQALSITVPMGAPLFLIAALVTGQVWDLGEFSGRSFIYLALAGIFHIVWGRYCNYRATKAMGSVLVGPVQQAGLLLALVLAVVVLDETLTVLKILGIVLIIFGPGVIAGGAARARRKRNLKLQSDAAAVLSEVGDAADTSSEAADTSSEANSFKPNYVEGYFFGLLTATGYGISPILVSAGLADSGLPLAGGLISYTAAAVVIVALILPTKLGHVLAMDRTVAKWFTLSGVAVSVAQMFRYLAFAIAPVTIVAPIIRLSIVFRVIWSYFINREYETFESHVLIGIAISFIGVVALTVDSDFVVKALNLPAWAMEISAWRWPN